MERGTRATGQTRSTFRQTRATAKPHQQIFQTCALLSYLSYLRIFPVVASTVYNYNLPMLTISPESLTIVTIDIRKQKKGWTIILFAGNATSLAHLFQLEHLDITTI